MTIFDLTIGRLVLLIEALTDFFLGNWFFLFKSSILILSLFISFYLLWLWLKYEMKNKEEISKWSLYLKSIKDFYFLKESKKTFQEIKELFYKDKFLALQKINEFLNFVLETFGYEGNLEEKLTKINSNFLPSLENLKKAISIYNLIEEKFKNNREINLTEDEYLLVFHAYEVALKDLNILTTEDFLVKNLK